MIGMKPKDAIKMKEVSSVENHSLEDTLPEDGLYCLLFTDWVQGPYEEIQAQGFSYSPSLRGLFGKPRACISWYGTSTQLVNSLLHDPF